MLIPNKESFNNWIGNDRIYDDRGEEIKADSLDYPVYLGEAGKGFHVLNGKQLRDLAVDVFGILGEQYQR